MTARVTKRILAVVFFSILLWWGLLIWVFDFGFIHEIRERLSTLPVVSKLNPLFGNSMAGIFHDNYRFSRLFDVAFISAYLKPETLPRYRLTVSEANLKQLDLAAQKALEHPEGFLLDEFNIKVPAQFSFQGKDYAVKIQYRGDNQGHWTTHHKSWRIIFVTPAYFLKDRVIQLILPENRGFLDEALSKHVSRKLNLLTQKDSFVYLTINGEDVGVYYQMEQFNTNFLERNYKPAGNLYSDRFGDVPWSTRMDLITNLADWKKIVINPSLPENDFSDLNLLLQLIRENRLGQHNPLLNQIIDKNSFLNWQAHTVLMGSTHQDNLHNMKLFINGANGAVEFIPDDERFTGSINKTNSQCQTLDFSYNVFFDVLLSQPEWLLERNIILWNYVSNDKTIADDYNWYDNLYQSTQNAFRRGSRYSTVLQFEYAYRSTRKSLHQRYQLIKQMLSHPPIPLVKVKYLPDKANIIIDTQGPSGFSVETITIADIIHSVHEKILPELAITLGQFCIPYAPKRVQYTLPCTDCQNKKLYIQMKNLTTGAEVEPTIQYE